MFKSVIFKIWLPFTVIIFILFVIMGIYYPQKQKKIIFEQKKRELKELAQNISLSVEYSLNNQNYSSLKRSIDFIKGTSDFGFVAVYSKASDSTLSLFKIIPEEAISYLNSNEKNKNQFIIAKSDFNSNVLNGYVLIAFKRKIIEQTIETLNMPVYIMIVFSFFLSILVFYSIAKKISKPLVELADQTISMESGDYSKETKIEKSSKELEKLTRGFEMLRKSLLKSEKKNAEILFNLEEKVKTRTLELNQVVTSLNEAQKIARFGSYVLDIKSNKWESSDSLNEILGIDDSFNRNLDNFISIITEKYRFRIIKSFEEALFFGKEMKLEYELVKQNNKKIIKVRGYGRVEYDKDGKPDKISGVIQDISQDN